MNICFSSTDLSMTVACIYALSKFPWHVDLHHSVQFQAHFAIGNPPFNTHENYTTIITFTEFKHMRFPAWVFACVHVAYSSTDKFKCDIQFELTFYEKLWHVLTTDVHLCKFEDYVLMCFNFKLDAVCAYPRDASVNLGTESLMKVS